MEMPTTCDCGETVEFDDMNPCNICEKRFCKECCPEIWGDCKYCKTDE